MSGNQTNHGFPNGNTTRETGHHDPTFELTELDPLDHEYEPLDNYNYMAQKNKAIQPPIPSARQSANTDNYKLTECPAYSAIVCK